MSDISIKTLSNGEKMALLFYAKMADYYDHIFISKYGDPDDSSSKFLECKRIFEKHNEQHVLKVIYDYLSEAHEYPPTLAKLNALLKGKVSSDEILSRYYMITDKTRVRRQALGGDPIWQKLKKVNYQEPVNRWIAEKHLSFLKQLETEGRKQELIAYIESLISQFNEEVEQGKIDLDKYNAVYEMPELLEQRHNAVET